LYRVLFLCEKQMNLQLVQIGFSQTLPTDFGFP